MARAQLGEIDLRSGTLVVVDFGCLSLFGSSPAEVAATLEEALAGDGTEAQVGALAFVVVRGLPAGRFSVTSERLDEGEYAGMRRDVTVELGEGETARTISLGTILVDTARVGLFDREALAAWNEHEPSDGLADVAFWGGDEDEVARRFGVGRIAEGVYGRENLPYDEAVELGRALHALRESRELRFAFDFRPHTHPFHLLAQIRSREDETGTLELDGLRSCGFMTTWGDGWFPVELDVDASERPLRVRVVFDTEEAEENLDAVNAD
jgi:hypothetical protein